MKRLVAWLWIVLAAAPGPGSLWGATDVNIKLGVLPGLKFDVPRFVAEPGAKVTITFNNGDQMIHNIVVTEPGARNEVVMAALALGADGPAKQFVPDTKKVLWATKALAPGESATLTFTAPMKEDVYPYVCTYTGHGFVMFGAMYVTTKGEAELPALESDPNVPPPAVVIADMSDHSRHVLDRPVVSRTFLPDCGPAAVAVGLPGGQSYVFDAGACRLRYMWKGGFVDNNAHWQGKGDDWGKVVGRVYYRAPGYHPIRIGDVNRQPRVQWKGYAIDKGGYPQLRYTVDGVEVRETAQARTDGIDFTYEVASAPGAVYYMIDPDSGVTFNSSAGGFDKGVLKLTAEQARRFTIGMTERPGAEPIAYYSMNDAIFPARSDPKPGVVGRAFTPGGEGRKPLKLASGVTTGELAGGGTLMAWVKLDGRKPDERGEAEAQAVFSAGEGGDAMVIHAPASDDRWHHVAVVFSGGKATLYSDGQPRGPVDVKLPAKPEPIVIGSIGEKLFLKGLLDEVRVYGRPLDATEVQKVYHREKTAGAGAGN